MPKRSRTSSIEVKAVDTNGIVIQYGTKEYYVTGGNEYIKFLENPELECTVIHNRENRAMLNIEDIRYGEDILRQEINPVKYKDIGEWVRDE